MDRRLGPASAVLAALFGVVAAVLVMTGHRDRPAHPVLKPSEIEQPAPVTLSRLRACLTQAGLGPRPVGHGTLSLRGVSSGRDLVVVYASTGAAGTAYRGMNGGRATWYGNNVVLRPGDGPPAVRGAAGRVLRCATRA